MITDVTEDKMLVVSDLHIGNPFCETKRSLLDFFDWVATTDYSLCINGDGLEVAQTKFLKLAVEIPDVLTYLRKLRRSGRGVYFVIGNHDIVLEHLLQDWDFAILSPFLNVASGDKRIRIEHGHIYDPMFVSRPRLYAFLTKAAGLVLDVCPSAYRAWMSWEKMRYGGKDSAITGEPEAFGAAAREILDRGFDAVVFGHTHQAGMRQYGEQCYVNSGSWMLAPNYVKIDHGKVSLESWEPVRERTILPPEMADLLSAFRRS
jgi:UDP-2,3-diacylglucosamine pyrophosphatase LpxH